ncbi:MAG TPA: DNA-directed RNA polymerase subunit K [Candidatus Bathyarchaeia archaeon]|nr:DNA-directed RNA polymerase subunit K [Candidatus Bathyarchaeia archaeon]
MVVKHSSNQKTSSKEFKTKTAKPMNSSVKKSASTVSRSKKKITGSAQEKAQLQGDAPLEKSIRPQNEVVTYAEVDFELKEIIPNDKEVLIGPTRITRFEKARITGARSLQLSLGAPAFIKVPPDVRDSVSLATSELDAKALPISIRRVLPNGVYQDIPIAWLK